MKLNARTWKVWVLPGGLLLGLVAVLVQSAVFSQVAPSLSFYYVAVFATGLALAWRFHSSRAFFSLLTLLLAHRAVEFFSAGHARGGPGHMAVTLAAIFVPVNFMAFTLMKERGFAFAGVLPRAAVLFFESVAVAVLCRPENSTARMPKDAGGEFSVWLLGFFGAALAVCIWRYIKTRKPIEPGVAWSLAAVVVWLEFAPIGKVSDAYVATAGLILGASLIETSYVLAYHDELTGIRGRRAFNEALLSLDQQYAIGIVDIDHFKKFNDTYGHDVGDQVLCMVASRLAETGGGGQAFRCGGEEFAILFRDASAKEAFEHLEALRGGIERSEFRVRRAERRLKARGGQPERRRGSKKKSAAAALSAIPDRLSVTVSIGVAEPSTRNREPEQVIQAADQALYRAKERGRNRVEVASTAPLRVEKAKRARASQS